MIQLGSIIQVSFLVLLPALSSCGKWAKAPNISTVSNPIPEYPSFKNHVMNLTDQDQAIGYGGTLLIFNDSADSALIADVLQASIDSRQAWANAKNFEVDSKFNALYAADALIPTALVDMKSELRRFEREARAANPVPYQEKKDNTRVWIQKELDRLYGEGHSPEREKAETIWGYYCDAKIIELASNSNFATRTYLARPTPMAFCEAYYESAGFFQGDSCQSDASGRSYFQCLWQEGVFRTYWFKEYYFNPGSPYTSKDAPQVLTDFLSEQNLIHFQGSLALDENILTLSSPAYKRLVFGPKGEIRSYFSDLILKQEAASRLCQRIQPNLSQICEIFKFNRPQNLQDVPWKSTAEFPLSPYDTISVIEDRSASLSRFFIFPDRPDSTIGTKTIISYFGQRNFTDHTNSESDRNFHLLASGEILPNPNFDEVIQSKANEVQTALADDVYGKLDGTNLEFYQNKLSKIQAYELELENAKKTRDQLQDKIRDTSDQGFRAGNAGDPSKNQHVAHAFIEVQFKLSQRDGILRGYLWIKGHEQTAVLGCYDLQNQFFLKNTDCQADARDRVFAKNWFPAEEFRVDPQTGRLDYSFIIEHPKLMGLGYKPRVTNPEMTSESFMDFADDFLTGKALAFELYPNRLGHLEILTGKAFIRGDLSIHEFEAGVSLWDQNL